MRGIAERNVEAFDECYRLLSGRVYGYIRLRLAEEADVEDVLQDTFLAVWNQGSSFAGQSKVSSFVLGIARHKLVDKLRHKQRQLANHPYDSGDEHPEEAKEGFESNVVQRLSWEAALLTLPDDSRELLYLVFLERWSYADIAAFLSIAEGTVKSRVHSLKARLRTLLGEEGWNHE